MEKYKKKLQADIFWGKIYCVITILLILSINIKGTMENTHLTNAVTGFLAGGMGSILYHIRKKSLTLKNEEALKKLYIQNTDERIELIAAKAARSGINIILIGFCVVMIISANFSEIIFYTLMVCVVFLLVVILITTAFYNKKL